MLNKSLLFCAVLLLLNYKGFSQQMVLGNNPYTLNKSAVLELSADNQGFLLPRLTDTVAINSLNPPDGMLIFYAPTQQLMMRTNGSWSAIVVAQSLITGLSGDVTASGTGVLNTTISNNAVSYSKIQHVSASNKILGRASTGSGIVEEISLGSGFSFSGTTLNLSAIPNSALANSGFSLQVGTSGTDINVSGSPVSLGSTLTLNLPSASAANRGLLTSTDWNNFNNKESALTISTGLTRTTNTITANLSTGIAGGQTATGGTAASNNLRLSSTSHATKGKILFGTSAYDEANNRLGIRNSIPTEALDVTGNVRFSGALMPGGSAGTSGQILKSNGAGASPTWTSADTSWNTNGNAGTSPTNNFLGTTDNKSLIIKTNNTERVRVENTGKVGIGDIIPNATLDVNGSLAYRVTNITIANGANNHNLDVGNASFARLTGSTANFEISGIAGGYDGRVIILVNSTANDLKLKRQNTSSLAENRIQTPDNVADFTVKRYCSAILIYSAADAVWFVLSV